MDARVADVVSRSPNAPLQLGPGAAAIEAAVALALARESIVVISTSPPRIVGGYGIIALIRGADNPWTALYMARAVDVSWTPVYARPDEQIMDVVDRMRSSGHYNALVMEGDRISGLLTTLDLARFLHSIGALRGKAPVGSAIVGIDPDVSLGAAMDLMIERGLRRLAISGTDFMVSDRSLMRGSARRRPPPEAQGRSCGGALRPRLGIRLHAREAGRPPRGRRCALGVGYPPEVERSRPGDG